MFKREKAIPSAAELIAENPLPERLKAILDERVAEIKGAVSGRNGKLLVVVGPCSAHASAPVLEYVSRLGKLNEEVKDKLVLVPRLYTVKPRTRGTGYQGMAVEPKFGGKADVATGLACARALHLTALEVSGLAGAEEMLFPEQTAYLQDVVGYYAVGARSVEDPMHRLTASGLDVPVGMKNPLSGNLSAMVRSVYAARQPQTLVYGGYQVSTSGNAYAHAILRGSVDEGDKDRANYGYDSVMRTAELFAKNGLTRPALVIDCNHSNSGKDPRRQALIAREVLASRQRSGEYAKAVKGLMIESFLVEGSQETDEVFGKSVTDPCLGWGQTEKLIREIAELA